MTREAGGGIWRHRENSWVGVRGIGSPGIANRVGGRRVRERGVPARVTGRGPKG